MSNMSMYSYPEMKIYYPRLEFLFSVSLQLSVGILNEYIKLEL